MRSFLLTLFNRQNKPAHSIMGNLVSSCEFRYQLEIIDKGGNVKFRQPWRSHMISDWGMDNLFTSFNYADGFLYINVGNAVSPTPVRRDSAPITFTQTGNAVVASGNFFLNADVGRILKYNDGPGTEVYITGWTDAQHITVSGPSASIGPNTGTIWYVNRLTLDSVVSNMSGNLYGTTGGDNGTLFGTNTVTLYRKIIGATCTSPTTLTEIGFNQAGYYQNMWDMDIITGGVAVTNGDQAVASCQLVITYADTTPLAVGNVASGYDSSGTFQIETLGVTNTASYFQPYQQIILPDGSSSSYYNQFGPYAPALFTTVTAAFTQSVYSATAATIAQTDPGIGTKGTQLAYTNGSFFRDTYYKYLLAESNATIYGLALVSNGDAAHRGASLLFTTPVTKNSTQTLDFTVRKSLQRILVN
jgi:hypothetical protein